MPPLIEDLALALTCCPPKRVPLKRTAFASRNKRRAAVRAAFLLGEKARCCGAWVIVSYAGDLVGVGGVGLEVGRSRDEGGFCCWWLTVTAVVACCPDVSSIAVTAVVACCPDVSSIAVTAVVACCPDVFSNAVTVVVACCPDVFSIAVTAVVACCPDASSSAAGEGRGGGRSDRSTASAPSFLTTASSPAPPLGSCSVLLWGVVAADRFFRGLFRGSGGGFGGATRGGFHKTKYFPGLGAPSCVV